VADADANRGLVVSRSILAAAAGILPVPVMDDVVASLLRARMLRTIAEVRQVDINRDALAILSDEPQVSRLRHMALTGVTLIALRKAWRKMFLLLAVGRRGGEFAHSFELGTLFDHYCMRHHVGPAVDAELAAKLRATFDQIGGSVRKHLVRPSVAAGALQKRPREVLPREGESLLGKTRRVIDEELGAAGDAYANALREAFDKAWKRP
jgi:hypothetical protein